jgi:hypothetical protein
MSALLKTLRFWRFEAFNPTATEPLLSKLEAELAGQSPGFVHAYSSIVKAVAESDLKYLERVTEPRLYAEVKRGLESVTTNKGQLVLRNPEATVTSALCNSRLYFNVGITRKDSTPDCSVEETKYLQDFSDGMYARLNKKDIISYPFNKDCQIVLKVDVVFSSSLKLVLQDESGEEVRGKSGNSVERHMMRFETETKVLGSYFKASSRIFNGVLFPLGLNQGWIDDYDWLVTDIDECLEGNPFSIPK